MSNEVIVLLVFGVPFLILCLIYAAYALYCGQNEGQAESKRAARSPRLYITQQVPSVYDMFKKDK